MRVPSGLAAPRRATRAVLPSLAILWGLGTADACASAQDFAPLPRVQTEFRVDVARSRASSAIAMAGANVPLGLYVRLGVAAGGGASWRAGSAGAAGRADVSVRFLLDPFAESARGFYAGGGLTLLAEEARHAGLLVLLGVEGRAHRGYRVAAEVGLGEGARVAMVLRRSRRAGR